MKIVILVFSIVVFFFLARDMYLAWFQPKKFIDVLRGYYHFQVSLFPFLRKQGYPDENFSVQLSKVALPIMVIMDIVLFFAALVQILDRKI